MAELMTERPSVGVSACLDRCPVRYNGKAFDAVAVLGRERGDFVFTPVCPECMAGFGVPRTPVHLTGSGAQVLAGEARVRDRHGRDLTERLVGGSRACLEALRRADVEAVIVKESSPSCGVYRARVGRRRREQAGGPGVFGAMLLETDWFLIPDTGLGSALRWWDWRRRLHAFLWVKRREPSSAKELYDTWHVVKSVVRELDRPLGDRLGRSFAGLPRHPAPEELAAARREMLDALRRPSSPERIRRAMWKTYAHAKKRCELEGVDLHDLSVASPEVRRNVTAIAEDLLRMERISYEHDLLFGTSPVIHRSRPHEPPSR